MINEDYSINVDIDRYQSVLGNALSNVDFSIGTGIYLLPNNLNLNIGKASGYNNKTLISNIDMKIGSNRNINKAEIFHQKSQSPATQSKAHAAPEMHLMKSSDKPIKETIVSSPLVFKIWTKRGVIKNLLR